MKPFSFSWNFMINFMNMILKMVIIRKTFTYVFDILSKHSKDAHQLQLQSHQKFYSANLTHNLEVVELFVSTLLTSWKLQELFHILQSVRSVSVTLSLYIVSLQRSKREEVFHYEHIDCLTTTGDSWVIPVCSNKSSLIFDISWERHRTRHC